VGSKLALAHGLRNVLVTIAATDSFKPAQRESQRC